MRKFLTFDHMIMPYAIQLFFWLSVFACVISGIMQLTTNHILKGLVILFLGPIFMRLLAEMLVIPFRIHSALKTMNDQQR